MVLACSICLKRIKLRKTSNITFLSQFNHHSTRGKDREKKKTSASNWIKLYLTGGFFYSKHTPFLPLQHTLCMRDNIRIPPESRLFLSSAHLGVFIHLTQVISSFMRALNKVACVYSGMCVFACVCWRKETHICEINNIKNIHLDGKIVGIPHAAIVFFSLETGLTMHKGHRTDAWKLSTSKTTDRFPHRDIAVTYYWDMIPLKKNHKCTLSYPWKGSQSSFDSGTDSTPRRNVCPSH